jgi:hypothetical protein
LQSDAASTPDLKDLVARFGGFSRMPVDECAKFDAVMAAWESAAERGWRGDRDVALLAEPAAWLRVTSGRTRPVCECPLIHPKDGVIGRPAC